MLYLSSSLWNAIHQETCLYLDTLIHYCQQKNNKVICWLLLLPFSYCHDIAGPYSKAMIDSKYTEHKVTSIRCIAKKKSCLIYLKKFAYNGRDVPSLKWIMPIKNISNAYAILFLWKPNNECYSMCCRWNQYYFSQQKVPKGLILQQ